MPLVLPVVLLTGPPWFPVAYVVRFQLTLTPGALQPGFVRPAFPFIIVLPFLQMSHESLDVFSFIFNFSDVGNKNFSRIIFYSSCQYIRKASPSYHLHHCPPSSHLVAAKTSFLLHPLPLSSAQQPEVSKMSVRSFHSSAENTLKAPISLWVKTKVLIDVCEPCVSPMILSTSPASALLPAALLHTLAFYYSSVLPHTCCFIGLSLLFPFWAVLIPWVCSHVTVSGRPSPCIKWYMYSQWYSHLSLILHFLYGGA